MTSTAQFYGSGQDSSCVPTIHLYAMAAVMSVIEWTQVCTNFELLTFNDITLLISGQL